MTGFEFLFSFYALLLGLAVANVASHFADMWRSRSDMRVGAIPILLGLFILLAGAQQWMSFWNARDSLTMGAWELLTCLGMALPYIFVSQAMFPRAGEQWVSIEDYYLANRRVLVGTLALPALVSMSYNAGAAGDLRVADVAAMIASYAPRIAIPLLLAISGNRWAHRIGLGVLCLIMLIRLFR